MIALAFGAITYGANAQSHAEWDIPISKLPENIKCTEGDFSIFADFDNAEGQALTIYIINDTEKKIHLPAQDGDIYIKQEAKLEGQWQRSQPHQYSWCGNSYMRAPSISSKHFAMLSTKDNRWASRRKPVENGEKKMLPVRYRFYTELHHDVISNQGEMMVSTELIRLSEFDTMALRFGSVEKLAAVATGEVDVKSLDHMKPKSTAISGLSKYPGNQVAQSAMHKVIKELYHLEKDEKRQSHYFAQNALGVVSKIFGPDEAQSIYLGVIKDESFPYRSEALNSLAIGVKEKQSDTEILLEGFLNSYDDPLYSKALYLRGRTWPKDVKRRELKRVRQDESAPEEIRQYAERLYYGSFPNPYVKVWMNYSFKTALTDVSIENISKEPIELNYSHFYDLFSSKVELGFGKEQIPYRKDFKSIVNAERSKPIKKVLKPGEKLSFRNVNVWRYHQISEPFPENYMYRVISNLPKFGDVPAGRMTSYFNTDDDKKRKILQDAVAEQR